MKISRIINSKKTIANLERLYCDNELIKKKREITRLKLRNFCLTMGVTLAAFMALTFYLDKTEGGYVESLKRNAEGEGSRTVSLIALFEGTKKSEKLDLTVDGKQYTPEKIAEFTDSIEEVIWDEILADNKSLDEVTGDLDLVTSIEGYPFSISWKSERPLLISAKGVVDKDKINRTLKEEGTDCIDVRLCATLTYEDIKQDIYGYVSLTEDKEKTYEGFVEDVNEAIEDYDDMSKSRDEQLLPKEVDGVSISYRKSPSGKNFVVLIVGAVCAIGLVIAKDKEIEKEVTKRNEELERDYPKILNQYALYYCAGMSHRNIWDRICSRYELELTEGGSRRYAYEEMLRCKKKIEDGTGELAAYDEFAKRCGSARYRSFINLIGQSVKKGREDLGVLLDEEVERALKEENTRVRMAAQELSTKLLFPMLLMLVIVLVIVMVPAFISFGS